VATPSSTMNITLPNQVSSLVYLYSAIESAAANKCASQHRIKDIQAKAVEN